MKITWLGHSCFKIEKDGYKIIIDPYMDGSVPGLEAVREQADCVFASHEHGDHNGTECVVLMKNGMKNPFEVKMIETYHDDVQGMKRGKNKVFLISDNKEKIVHLGDLGCSLELEQKEFLKNIDVLLVPVGGYYTIGSIQAMNLIGELKPKHVIPMHYRDDEKGIGFSEIDTIDSFLEIMDSVMTTGDSFIDTDNSYSAQVIVLQPLNAIV